MIVLCCYQKEKGNVMQTLRTVLVIIDPQNCFMDLPWAPLPVKGAIADMTRLIRFIQLHAKDIDDIVVSLDTHVPDHISHAQRWVDEAGNHPAPFTVIPYLEYLEGKWRATNRERDWWWQGEYLRRLSRPHLIWPVHGQKPEPEWQVFHDLDRELDGRGNVRYIEKGLHRDVEQFGIFGPEVQKHDDPTTEMNLTLISEIDAYDRVIFAGEASSHCVMDSVKQFLAHMPSRTPQKVVLLKDCMSPVSGFEALAAFWLTDMAALGVQVVASTDLAHDVFITQ
jgi:nicotinamidase/pyrazinamidase